jgi:hypothetical protein
MTDKQKIVQDLIRKWQARQRANGPLNGEWVIMPNGEVRRLGSDGIGEHHSWVSDWNKLPVDAVRIPRDPNRVSHPVLTLDFEYYDENGHHHGRFFLHEDGKARHSGGNDFHDLPRRAKLIDTGFTKPGQFSVFKMEWGAGGAVEVELECRVYRLIEDQPPGAA